MSPGEAIMLVVQAGPAAARASSVLVATQAAVLVLVAGGATAVVATRNQIRQAIILSIYGVLLAVLFLVFQAPDVTLSELTVGAVILPLLILLTLAKTRDTHDADQRRDGGPGSAPDKT